MKVIFSFLASIVLAQCTFAMYQTEQKPYMYGESHIAEDSDAIQINKGKPGDNQVFQAMMMDPNVKRMHVVFSGITDTEGAHKNLEHYIQRHIEKPKPYFVYHAPNHLQEKEHHETKFDTKNEDGTPVEIKGPKYDFETDLQKNLKRNRKVWLYSSAPTQLEHLDHIARAVRAKNGQLDPINLSVGHNSQQFAEDREMKVPMEEYYLENAQKVVQNYLPRSRIRFHNSRMSFPGSWKKSVSRNADETKDLFHPTTQKQAEQDIFYGPTIKNVHKDLLRHFGDQHSLPDPHPPIYHDVDFEDAVQDMLTTHGKEDWQLGKVLEGREHLGKFLNVAPYYMQQAIESGNLTEDQKRKMGKRLARMGQGQFAQKFSGSNPLPVEMGDPIALAAHRQALHNQEGNDGQGPHYKRIAFERTDRGMMGKPAGEEDDDIGDGLFDANSNEAFADHKQYVKNQYGVGYIPDDARNYHNHPSSSRYHGQR